MNISSPIEISSTTPVEIASYDNFRYLIRYQNVGTKKIYIKKHKENDVVSSTNYQILLEPNTAVECRASDIYYAISEGHHSNNDIEIESSNPSSSVGKLAIYEESIHSC
jgi:hypothetical protein